MRFSVSAEERARADRGANGVTLRAVVALYVEAGGGAELVRQGAGCRVQGAGCRV